MSKLILKKKKKKDILQFVKFLYLRNMFLTKNTIALSKLRKQEIPKERIP